MYKIIYDHCSKQLKNFGVILVVEIIAFIHSNFLSLILFQFYLFHNREGSLNKFTCWLYYPVYTEQDYPDRDLDSDLDR